MLVNSVSYFLVIVCSLVEVHSQVCVIQTIVTKQVMGTYSKSYRDIYGFSPRSRLRTKIIERWITQTQVKEIKFCCDGYSKEYYNMEASRENCKPICSFNCTNGYCKHPEECACNTGYTKRNETCVPLCERNCLHGTCVAPDTCRCDSGYNLANDTCQPVCTKPCRNGTCTSPETCECDYGYYLSKYEFLGPICRPICLGGCPTFGYCHAPESCKCHSGWRLSENNSNKCLPVCTDPCGNGTCVSPSFCECFPGFDSNYSSPIICVPICKDCGGSNCVAPNICVNERTSRSGNEDTTTTTRIPFNTMSTHNHYFNHNENTPLTTTVMTSYFVSSISSTERVVRNDTNTDVTLGYTDTTTNVILREPEEISWMQQHRMFIWIPVIVIVTTGLILLLVWRRTIIINYFKRRSYNVQGAFLSRNVSGSFGNLHFISDERELQS